MPTIDELMQGKQPGEIKIRNSTWMHPDKWFRPYYKTAVTWYGLSSNAENDWFIDSEDWQIWQAPTTRCEDCENLRKERDKAVSALESIKVELNVWERAK